LAPLVSEEMRRLAERELRRERPGHTLQCPALVHEALSQIDRSAGELAQSRAFLRDRRLGHPPDSRQLRAQPQFV
jgi:ECF sigma factor